MRKYVVLAVITLIIYFCQAFFTATGGIGADSLSYFGIASDLPELKTNLFPLGYPVLIQFFHVFSQDYFWASKMLNISMVLIILLFSFFKEFYFKETVLLFAGKTLFFVLNGATSEGPFVFILYFLIYFFHERFQNKIKSKSFIFNTSLLLFLLFTIRYSGIYIYLGVGVFWLMLVLQKKNFHAKLDLFKVLWVSGTGISCYLGFNYYIYGSFTGENLRGAPEQYYAVYILRDFLGITNVVNPFIGIKPASNSLVSIGFQVVLMVLDLFLLQYFIKLIKWKKVVPDLDFHRLLWIISGVYAVTLLISGYFQQIEEMNVRMLAAANFCLFFSFLLIYFKNLNSDKIIFRTGGVFLLFLTFYSLKMPENYFKNRKQIEVQMPKVAHKKYLYNNEKHGSGFLTTYYIPLINKNFQYKHSNIQQGEIKQSIGGTINPQIKWIKYDTIRDKREVLYTSELVLE